MNSRLLVRWCAVVLGVCAAHGAARAAVAPDGYILNFPDSAPPVYWTNWGWTATNQPSSSISNQIYAYPTNQWNPGFSVLALSGGSGLVLSSALPYSSSTNGYPVSVSSQGVAQHLLVQSGFGFAVEGDKPDVYLGDPVRPPQSLPSGYSVDWLTVANWATNMVPTNAPCPGCVVLSATPTNTNYGYSQLLGPDTSATGIFLEPSIPTLYAAEGGTMNVAWPLTNFTDHSSLTNTYSYTVSSSPQLRPHRIFWTEPPYNAPPVNLSGRHVRFRWNTAVPAPETSINYQTNYDAKTNIVSIVTLNTNVTRGLWLDASGLLHAAPGTPAQVATDGGLQGMVLMQYFTTGSQDTQIQSNGVIVVEVAEPRINVLTNFGIGDRLEPQAIPYRNAKTGIVARVTQGLSASPAYVYQYQTPTSSPKNGAVYAVNDSSAAPWNIEIYWEEADLMGTRWPYEVDWYGATWRNTQLFARDPASGTVAPAYLPSVLAPNLWSYQDPPGNAQLHSDGTFFTTLAPGVTNAYCLLQFSGKDANGVNDVWFQAVQSVAYTNSVLYPPGLGRDPIPWPIGSEIRPLLNAYALSFDGVSDSAVVTNFTWDGGKLAVEAHVRVDQPDDGVTKPILTLVCTNCVDGGWSVSLAVAGDSTLSLGIVTNVTLANSATEPTNVLSLASTSTLANGIWQRVGFQIDGTTAKLSVDGAPVNLAGSLSTNLGSAPAGLPGPVLWLGTDLGLAGAGTNLFRGLLDALALGASSADELAIKFRHGSLVAVDPPGGGSLLVEGSVTNGVSYGAGLVAYTDGPGHPGLIDLPRLSADRDFIYDPARLGRYNASLYTPASAAEPTPESYVYGVNAGTMEVWWLQEVRQPGMPSNLVFFPRLPQIYTNVWPDHAPKIVLTSGKGSPELPLSVIEPPRIYSQPDPTVPGYNPNEEHALMAQTDDGRWVAYALRDDLGGPESSEPFVLVDFVDSVTGVPGMKAFHVVRSNPAYPAFSYSVTVPALVTGPHPLDFLPGTTNTSSSSPQAWRDRRLNWWAVGAGSGNTGTPAGMLTNTALLLMAPWYPLQPGFWFPGLTAANQPPVNTPIPWLPPALDPTSPMTGPPITTSWTASWPTSNVPVMQVGQTLTVATTNALPDVWDAKSVDVVYQQTNATQTVDSTGRTNVSTWSNSVMLFDPTRARNVSLPDPTQGIDSPFTVSDANAAGNVYNLQGRYYFRGLAPDLSNRLYWDPTTQSLTLIGSLSGSTPTYLLVNALSPQQVTEIIDLNPSSTAWAKAVGQLPTFSQVTNQAPNTPFDHLALSATGTGAGYVTLAFNNASNPAMDVHPGDPITLQVLQVTNTLYSGFVVPLEDPLNLLSKQMTVLYSETFAGQVFGFDFDWRAAYPSANGTVPTNTADAFVYATVPPLDSIGLTRLPIGGTGATLADLANRFFAVRYRATNALVQQVVGTNYSAFTPFNLAEGWVQRVLNALTPFEQRLRDLMANPVETQGTMIQQAGPPYTAPIALNMSAIDQYGLIQLYSTVLDEAKSLSIDASQPLDLLAANQQLLLAANRLNALYMVLGNEAYADALDPTIGFGSQAALPSGKLPKVEYGALASSLFCFDNQVPSLLDEELALLRGRGNPDTAPGMTTGPYYNRLFWNFTKGIDAGEVAYAVNYNTHAATNVLITAATAAGLYPQGHGDAWGHYLSALRGYLELLTNPSFTWGAPSADSMLLDPESDPYVVTAGYRDEQRIAQTAAALTRAGVEIVRRAARKAYTAGPPTSALDYPGSVDTDTDRAWGVVEWAGRAGALTLNNWALCQSLLPPATATNSIVENLLDSDRNSVRELDEIVADYRTLQQAMDDIDRGVNPLGVAAAAVPFDISPTAVDGGQSHFEQIYQRAVVALENASAAFDGAQDAARLLREQSESALRLDEAMNDQEASYIRQLLQIYGYPYADDIGPSGAYPQGYDGPDLFHYAYVDLAEVGFDPTAEIHPMLTLTNLPISAALLTTGGVVSGLTSVTVPGASVITNTSISLTLARSGLVAKPDTFVGSRRAEGQLQQAYRNYLGALLSFRAAYSTWTNGMNRLTSRYDWYHSGSSTSSWYGMEFALLGQGNQSVTKKEVMNDLRAGEKIFRSLSGPIATAAKGAFDAIKQGSPLSEIFGMSGGGDLSFLARAIAVLGSTGTKIVFETGFGLAGIGEAIAAADSANAEAHHLQAGNAATFRIADEEMRTGILDLARAESVNLAALFPLMNEVNQAAQQFLALQAQGEQLQAERARVRTAAANRLAMGRYNDMAFRIFRNDALRRYGDAFEVAARYTYLAAKAYDYETCLLPSEKAYAPGALFLEQVVRARTVGRLDNGQPVVGSGVGDPGLADVLARMNGNWQVLKGRLGFNNPDTETSYFSLRQELFRIPTNAVYDGHWTRTLRAKWVDDIRQDPAYRQYCLPFSAEEDAGGPEPGLVIRFPTTIQFGRNFFDKPLAGGDGAYDSSHFATKIRGVGVWFSNYDEVVRNHPDAQLAREPRIYLVPAGLDKMRSPTGDGSAVRQWRVVDQVIPVPYPVGDDLDSGNWMPIRESLPGPWAQARRHPAMRAYQDRGFSLGDLTYSSRLVGRSVWNDEWCLILPAGTLGHDRIKALEAFVGDEPDSSGSVTSGAKGVSDIKLYFQTYSYHGN